MITLRRATERQHDQHDRRDVWLTFHPQHRNDPFAGGFGTLETLDEGRLPPGGKVSPGQQRRDSEILTYVRDGSLAYEDSTGRSGVIHAGEFELTTTSRRVRQSETNASRADWAHVFQISLRQSQSGLEPGHEQKRFSVAERRGGWCVVASPDGRRGSLRIHQDAMVYAAILEPGQHVVHELAGARTAWIHVIEGAVTLGDLVLSTGDGAGITGERAVSLTAQERTEILLVDVGGRRDPTASGSRDLRG